MYFLFKINPNKNKKSLIIFLNRKKLEIDIFDK
jgi:hypothetical protein